MHTPKYRREVTRKSLYSYTEQNQQEIQWISECANRPEASYRAVEARSTDSLESRDTIKCFALYIVTVK